MDRVTADADLLDLVLVDPEGVDNLVLRVHQDPVRDVVPYVYAERQMIHDVGTGQRVALRGDRRDDPPIGKVDGMCPGPAGTYVYGDSVSHSSSSKLKILLSIFRKRGGRKAALRLNVIQGIAQSFLSLRENLEKKPFFLGFSSSFSSWSWQWHSPSS